MSSFNHIKLKTDQIVIGSYVLSGFALFLMFYFNMVSISVIKKLSIGFGIMWPILLYSFYYKSLRQSKIILIFSTIGVIQVLLFIIFKDVPSLCNNIGGSYLSNLLYLPAMLITFYCLNYLNKLIYGDDLIITGRGDSLGGERDGRKIRLIDFVFSLLGGLLFIFGVMFTH
ncbi:hypothetical protein [Nonlabens ulvanivorans]|uniref:hypothetical protein n=1 Tax=Nonlabens ulvanivorans TaxID=906888 RepID=UPI0029420DE2|nr:hypothetical protein [Nonlabens ulvanivorans]WOI23718.1 hypothetical protein R1T42_04505 [Nonlabens ulvanivorans]